MRVDQLHLPNFRNLRDFVIDFDENSARTVLIGRNGVGKTNILEALTTIFRQLDLRVKPAFAYRIVFSCNGYRVDVEASPSAETEGRSVLVTSYKVARIIPNQELEFEILTEPGFYRYHNQNRLLPKHVFGYYSGTSPRLKSLFIEHTERYRDELIAGEEDTIRSLFLAEDWHSQFVLLAFYAKNDPEIRAFLLDQLGIEALESVLFVLQQPHWYKSDPPPEVRERGDERYWWAAGTVKRLLAKLHQVALAPMKTRERVPVGLKRHSTLERRYCFVQSVEDLGQIADDIDSKELFKRLESMVLSDLLHEVRIRFRVRGSETALSFVDLSEGEQQLLTVLGLLRFTNQDESLFLLDEPDTHLNPAWCLDYLDILKKYGGGLTRSQIIMTTHSPLVFAGLDASEVIILQRRDDDASTIEAEHPSSSPKGMGFSAILTSEFFGLRSSLDRASLALLDEKRRLGVLEHRTAKQEDRLRELNAEISRLDFTQTVNDPLYRDFVLAMTELEKDQPELSKAVLTPDALEARRKRAADVLKRVRERKGA
ncbi:AAA family ATPase [Methylobacterium sp. Leaf469]|uniref:AAA family ATPase n=1 Tax=Methylobacterium sp. Leaf469 TaxID=1736387 RepID=UPI0009E93152|nr:AAA family ATPase [Methylobacterium sp. Leaf469]